MQHRSSSESAFGVLDDKGSKPITTISREAFFAVPSLVSTFTWLVDEELLAGFGFVFIRSFGLA
jgi:hypothetical protein